MDKFSVIGKSISRIDGEEKVSGKAKYTDDFRLPGMLYGKILRSPYPHAKITNIDTSKAKLVNGVETVICGRDVTATLYGRYLADYPILATDKVRFIGEPVAADRGPCRLISRDRFLSAYIRLRGDGCSAGRSTCIRDTSSRPSVRRRLCPCREKGRASSGRYPNRADAKSDGSNSWRSSSASPTPTY